MFRLIPAILVVAAAFIVPAPADAGEVEVDVISAAIEAAYTKDPLDYDGLADAAVDLLDIFMDTEDGSYCEQFAASAFLIVTNWSLSAKSLASDEPSVVEYALMVGQAPLIDEIAPMSMRCLNES